MSKEDAPIGCRIGGHGQADARKQPSRRSSPLACWFPDAAAKRTYGLLLDRCVVSTSSLAAARDLPASTASEAEDHGAATLARLIYSEALNRAFTTHTIVNVVTSIYHADPNLRTMEADHPGLIAAKNAVSQKFTGSQRQTGHEQTE